MSANSVASPGSPRSPWESNNSLNCSAVLHPPRTHYNYHYAGACASSPRPTLAVFSLMLSYDTTLTIYATNNVELTAFIIDITNILLPLFTNVCAQKVL